MAHIEKWTGMTRAGCRALGVVVCLLAASGAAWGQIPTESDVYVDRGILAYDSRQYPEALQAFQEAVRLNETNVNALYYLGLTYLALDQPVPAQQALERARGLAPTDPDVLFQLGVSYFTAHQYERAEPIFRQLYARNPEHANLGYYLGFMEYRKQDYREALRFFRATRPSDESFAQLTRFYSGLALSALGFAGQARAEIEDAIRLQPMSPLSAPAEKFREVLGKAAKTEKNWSVEAKLGFYYDDNVAVIPDNGLDPAATAARSAKHRSTGELGLVRFEYAPLRTPDWDLTLGASMLGTVNNDVAHYNVLNPSLSAGVSYKTSLDGKLAVAAMLFQYDYMMLDDRNFSNRYTLAPSGTLVWDQTHFTQAMGRLQGKDYMHEKTLIGTADDRDGVNYMVGLLHYLRFQGDQHYLRFGYQIDNEVTMGNNWKYLGHRLILGGQLTLPWFGLKLRDDFDVHFRRYGHAHTYLPSTAPGSTFRKDTDLTNVVTLFKELPLNVTVSLDYLFNRDASSLDVFTYNRNVVTLSVNWRY